METLIESAGHFAHRQTHTGSTMDVNNEVRKCFLASGVALLFHLFLVDIDA